MHIISLIGTAALLALAACQSTSITDGSGGSGEESIDVGEVPDTSTSFVDTGAGGGGDAAGGGTGSEDTGERLDAGLVDNGNIGAPDGATNGENCTARPPDFADHVLFCDLETGSFWDLDGYGVSGELAGQVLSRPRVVTSFWFAWSTFYGGSAIWNRDTANSAPALGWEQAHADDESCLVPCSQIRQACGGGKDCIPALDHDRANGSNTFIGLDFVTADHEDAAYLDDDDLIVAVYIDGVARAYPHRVLWTHEIVNDEINGREFTVTLCPLTNSGIVFDADDDGFSFGVSGNLFNANLTMYDRNTDSWWSQMLGVSVTGAQRGRVLPIVPATHTRWGRWREMHPDTEVLSRNTGHIQSYSRYPYGDYRTSDGTFQALDPTHDPTFHAKDFTIGVVGQGGSTAYVATEMAQFGARVMINDAVGETPVAVFYEHANELSAVFDRRLDDRTLNFILVD